MVGRNGSSASRVRHSSLIRPIFLPRDLDVATMAWNRDFASVRRDNSSSAVGWKGPEPASCRPISVGLNGQSGSAAGRGEESKREKKEKEKRKVQKKSKGIVESVKGEKNKGKESVEQNTTESLT